MADETAGKRLFLARLGIGLAQGLVLYLLYHAQDAKAWPATNGLVFGPLLLVFLFIPLLANQALGEMAWRKALRWAAIATAVLAVLAVYDLWSAWPVVPNGAPTIIPSPRLFIFCAAGLFIAHALVVGAAIDGRLRASYTTHFDTAWKLAVQLVLAIAFVGTFWLLLRLGAELFALIKLDFFRRLLDHEWFSIPVTTLAAAGALHLTDIRPALVRGVRTLGLTLLSWLLPLLVVIVAGFLLSLPFTGLAPLWAVGHASALLLAAAAIMVVLINAAHQDGSDEHLPPRPVRWSGTAAALLPLPLGAIAIFALYLRVHQYGWTEDRVLVAAALTVAGFEALGYARAALFDGRFGSRQCSWLAGIENWNFLAALVTLAMIVLLSTPIADPRRIAVNDQMARLAHGAVKPDAFDIAFLRRDGGRYGRDALTSLTHAGDPRLQQAARNALKGDYNVQIARPPAELVARIAVYPKGKALPASFLNQDWSEQPAIRYVSCLQGSVDSGPVMASNPPVCEAVVRDLDGDGRDDVLLITTTRYGAPGQTSANRGAMLFQQRADGSWRQSGALADPVCDSDMAMLRSGTLKFVAAARPDLQIGGRAVHMDWIDAAPRPKCPENKDGKDGAGN